MFDYLLRTLCFPFQVYQADTGQYIFHNKYVGRALTEKGVVEELCQYLHNGCRLRTDLIEQIVHKLEDLHDMLSHQDSFRFYSSSLLVMYEGATGSSTDSGPSSSARHQKLTSYINGPYQEPESDTDRSDTGSEKSEHEEEECENDSEEHDKMELEDLESDLSRDSTDQDIGLAIASGSQGFGGHSHNANRVNGSEPSLVEVRMIDFAHSTHESLGLGDDGVHSGPDLGYMFGLESLIRLFREMAAHHVRTPSS